MDLFASLKAFVTVVDRGAFSRAARELGLSTSSLTRQVDSLEEQLGVMLLNRSTRRLTLTDGFGRFVDRTTEPDFAEELSAVNITLVGLGTTPNDKALNFCVEHIVRDMSWIKELAVNRATVSI